MAAESYLPLRWESTGDHWWYASPIDWAAANGHFDLVLQLLHLDSNLLIKLTSLRRIRRLESLWDDDPRFLHAPKARSFVARCLLLHCHSTSNIHRHLSSSNSLIRAGYGGWLLYTAAAAGDVGFVRELLEWDPLLVFGEGEYGVTDILYAAARSKNCEAFRVLLEFAARPKCLVEENAGVFRWEIANRAVHAAARGGSLEMLRELVGTGGHGHGHGSDVLAYRDVQGSTILHAAAGRGQVQVVKYILSSFNIIDSRDNQGNIALHIAAFHGRLSTVKALISACPSSSSMTNNAGDTFLHMAVAGFRTPGFRRLDRQMELMKLLMGNNIVNIREIINIRNNEGRTALHVAVIGYMHSDLVELLMTASSIDLNIRDMNGMTPLDLLRRRPRSASSEILIKRLVSAGGIFSASGQTAMPAIPSRLRMHGIGSSPGTSFKVSDSEIFLYTGIELCEPSGRQSSCSTSAKSEVSVSHCGGEVSSDKMSSDKRQSSVDRATKKLKILLRWPLRKEKKAETTPKKQVDGDSMASLKRLSEPEDTPTPLRQRFSKTSLLNRRTLAVRNSTPSPATKKKFAARLVNSMIQAMPHLAPPPARTPSDSFSRSGMSTPRIKKQKEICLEEEISSASCSNSLVKGGSEAVTVLSEVRTYG